jgi:hypothetical protein
MAGRLAGSIPRNKRYRGFAIAFGDGYADEGYEKGVTGSGNSGSFGQLN